MSTVKKINSRSTGISYHSPQNLSCTHLLSEGPPHPRHCDTSYPALSSSSSVTALNHLDVLKLTAKRQAGPPLALPTTTWHHASTHSLTTLCLECGDSTVDHHRQHQQGHEQAVGDLMPAQPRLWQLAPMPGRNVLTCGFMLGSLILVSAMM
jgi:hypothetical protein